MTGQEKSGSPGAQGSRGAILAEHSARPRAVIVHNPAPLGAFYGLSAVPAEEAQRRYLFRERVDSQRASDEHDGLVRAISRAGVSVITLRSLVGATPHFAQARTNPNQLFTRDAAITLPWAPALYLSARMAEPLRRPEEATMGAALEALGLTRLAWEGGHGTVLEGGDFVPFVREGRRCVLLGYGTRTTLTTVPRLREALLPDHADELIAVELARGSLNLDGTVLPVSDTLVIAAPDNIVSATHWDSTGTRAVDLLGLFEELNMTVVRVGRHAARTQEACNYLCLGPNTAIGYDMCKPAVRALRDHGIDLTAVPGSELVKGTGGPRCMSRPVYGPPCSDSLTCPQACDA
ncbi:dimethylarginine dimethylaminohydrolase family protein [Streptomyces sp. NRRL F-5755]|uniref:dimethylarginine dimethylaminohydrolase family protein n=1 Tax=Streptomyces sp. NRRL F-5755 TaxID=1519475 RepID=UPI000ACB1120|nr:arginine deiminase family protein [Streptomyces sp. NRRL F-5755]